MPFSRDLPDLEIEPRSPALQADSLLFELFGNPLDVHRTFRKTDKKVNITKFQEVEFLSCVIQLYIYTYIILEIILHYRL